MIVNGSDHIVLITEMNSLNEDSFPGSTPLRPAYGGTSEGQAPGEDIVIVLKVIEAYALHFSLSDFSL